MSADLVVGAGLVIAAAVVLVVACVIVGGAQPSPGAPEYAELDAEVERALEDGRADAAMAAACAAEAQLDPRLLPLSDSEVAQRIRAQMDENAAVRQLRADFEAWPFHGGAA